MEAYIKTVVRVRPWDKEKELPYVSKVLDQPFFLGDGNFAASPRRPLGTGSIREVIDVIDHRALVFDQPEPGAEMRKGQPGQRRYKDKRYIFDSVFPMHATQEEVFEKTAYPLLDGILNGYNATVFAYGATGCGKTHTISGTAADPGIIVRTTRELFNRIEDTKNEYDTFIEVLMVEIYKEQIRDLLSDNFPETPVGGLKLLESEKDRVKVDRVTLKQPSSVDQVMELVLLGNERRSTSYTESNASSSRSHAVLQINVSRRSKGHSVDIDSETVRANCTAATLSIIDLAGSERASATKNLGERMKEGAKINQSLLAVSSVITALSARPIRGVKPHIPYRNSKLTRMLRNSLGGNCRTVMIVCVSPSSVNIEDTHNTLVWANRAKEISISATQNSGGMEVRSNHWGAVIKKKQDEIDRLNQVIKVMEEGQRKTNSKRRDLELKDARNTLERTMREMDQMMEQILIGAKLRAEWDGAELSMAALRRAGEEAASAEKEFLEMLARRSHLQYAGNSQVVIAVQKETALRADMDKICTSIKGRNFGDTLETDDIQRIHLQLDLKKSDLGIKTMEMREKAHRETVQKQAESLASAARMLFQIKTSLLEHADLAAGSEQSDDMRYLATELRKLGQSSQQTLSSLFGASSSTPLPPLPQPTSHGANPFMETTQKPIRQVSTLTKPARRLSTHPETSFSRGKPGFNSTPAAKRLLNAGGKSRQADLAKHVASPRKRTVRSALVPVGKVGNPTPKKSMRWKGENSILEVKEYEIVTSDSGGTTQGDGDISGTADDSDQWGEIEDDVPELPKSKITLPKARNSILPTSLPPLPRLAPMPSIKLTSATPSGTSSSESDTAKQITPEWKKQRRLLGRATKSALEPLGEENTSIVQVDRSKSSISSGLIPPARLEPLGERRQIPGLPSSGSTSMSIFSNLAKPTIASSSRASLATGTSALGLGLPKSGSPPTSGPSRNASRRVSSIGPVTNLGASRSVRQKYRNSIFGSGGNNGEAAPPPASIHRPFGNTSTTNVGDMSINTQSALAGGARRMLDGGNSSVIREPALTLNRRASTMALNRIAGGGGVVGGPRPSVSGSSSMGSRGLTSRPSLANLTGTVGAGDQSIRGPWR